MKNCKLFLVITAFLVMYSISINAGTTTRKYYYFAQLTAQSTGNGKVYASTTAASTDNATAESSTAGPKQDPTAYGSSAPDNGAAEFFVYAKADEGYKFDGWSESSTRPSTFLSGEASYSYTVAIPKPTSTVNSAPTNATKVNATETESNMTGDATQHYSGTTSKKLYAYFSEKVNATLTFEPAEGGTYTYNCADGSGTVTTETQTVTTKEEITLTAIPDAGNKFYGWYTLNGTTENYVSYSSPFIKAFDQNITIHAKFIPTEAAIYTIKGTTQYFYDLNAAITAARSSTSKVVVPTQDGSVLPGTYTIPSGITLLIPYDNAYTVEKNPPTTVDPAAPTNCNPYRTLRLPEGTILNVEGSISVATKQYSTNTSKSYTGVRSPYGFIYTESGSKIILKNGSTLYAWGYISGEGEIIAQSGSVVYEMFQFTDFRGGTISVGTMRGNSQKVFLFEQYYIQNIESQITFEYGATENVNVNLYMSSSQFQSTVKLIGSSSSMFTMSSGCKVTKKYIRESDRQYYTVEGNASLSSITVKVSSYSISSNDYVLPIHNNMTIDVKAGGTMSLTQDISILPGAEINIEKDAIVSIPSNKSIYVYDINEWQGKGFIFSNVDFSQLVYVARNHNNTGGAPFQRSLTESAKFRVDGEMNISGGFYTTTSGANIYSTGTGKINYVNAPGTEQKTYQFTQTDEKFVAIGITSAQLKNADGTYVQTSGASAGTTYTYCDGEWITGVCTVPVNTYTITWKNYDGTVLETDEDVEEGTTPTYDGETPTKPSTAQYTYTFNNTWSPAVVAATEDAIYTAQFDSALNTYTVRFFVDGNLYDTQTIDYGSNAIAPDAPTKEGYTFIGWDKSLNNITADTEINAVFSINSYSITFQNADGTTLHGEGYSDNYEYGTELHPANPTMESTAQYTFTFREWQPALQPVTAIATYTAVYDSTVNKYTIRFVNWDGAELQSSDVEYDAMPIYSGETPTKDSTAQYSYTFANWTPAIEKVTGEATYTAAYDSALNTYGGFTFSSSDPVAGTVSVDPDKNEYEYGETVTVTATPNAGYEFAGWSDGSTEGVERVITIDETTTDVQALFSAKTNIKYTVKHWQQNITDDDYTEITADEQELTGTTATLTEAVPNVYTGFVALTIEQKNIAADSSTVVNVYYNRQIFEVKFVVEGVTVQTDSLRYEALPQYTGEIPTKERTAQYSYTFANWTPAIEEVTADITYTAQFSQLVNSYTITWKQDDSTVIDKTIVEYESIPTHADPFKPADEQYTYTFAGWNPEIVAVTSDAEYIATYTGVLNKYLIVFQNYDGTELQSGEWEYGATPVYTGETPTKEEDSENWYAFSGWTPEIVEVQNETTYTASFREIPKNGATGVSEVAETGEIVVIGHTIMISGVQEGKEVYVYDAQGNMIAQAQTSIETVTINIPSAGMYIVRLMDGVKKIVINQ